MAIFKLKMSFHLHFCVCSWEPKHVDA